MTLTAWWLVPIALLLVTAGIVLAARRGRRDDVTVTETLDRKLPPELIRKIRHIELSSKKLVESTFSGEYHSAFKGMGIEFAEVRPYQPGDDIRSIDWNVTARFGAPFIKIFEEERELTVILMVDASASGEFGTKKKFKAEAAAEVCATIAFSAIRNNDKVGLFIFTDKVELFIPPAKGRKHVLRIIRDLLFFKPSGTKTDIKTALEMLNRTIKRHAIVFLVSDFSDWGFDKPLRSAARKFDLVAIEIHDPAERRLPDAGLVDLVDAETGEEMTVDTSHPTFRKQYEAVIESRRARLVKLLRSNRMDIITVSTDGSSVEPLERFFKQREKRAPSFR